MSETVAYIYFFPGIVCIEVFTYIMMTVTEVNIINNNNSSFGTLFEKYSARD